MAGHAGAGPPAPTTRPRHLDGALIARFAIGAALIVAGGLVAAVNSATPFSHGSWLAAYLVLVGGVAQLALVGGPLLFPAPTSSPALTRAQLGLWNAGTAIVAVGVFTGSNAVVIVGSLLVVGALGCFARGTGPAIEPRRRLVLAYRLVIAVLAMSVVVGIVLSLTGGSTGS